MGGHQTSGAHCWKPSMAALRAGAGYLMNSQDRCWSDSYHVVYNLPTFARPHLYVFFHYSFGQLNSSCSVSVLKAPIRKAQSACLMPTTTWSAFLRLPSSSATRATCTHTTPSSWQTAISLSAAGETPEQGGGQMCCFLHGVWWETSCCIMRHVW